MSEDPYLIPGTTVLRNKLGITDPEELDRAERLLVVQRTIEGPPSGKFDIAHLKAIHRHLFQDVYDWAGEFRTLEISKGDSHFQPSKFIQTGVEDIHRRVTREGRLIGLNAPDFAEKAAEIIGDLNYVHPFREGNGRTQLEYLRQLGVEAGHKVNPDRLTRDSWMQASRASLNGDYSLMAKAILTQAMGEGEGQEQQNNERSSKAYQAALIASQQQYGR